MTASKLGFKSLKFRGWGGFWKILNKEQESTGPFWAIYTQTLLSVQKIWEMSLYSNKTVTSVEVTFPRAHNLSGITLVSDQENSKKTLSSLSNSVFKFHNSQIFLLQIFHLTWVTCTKTHSIHLVITTPIMNQSIVFPFIEKHPHKCLKNITHTSSNHTNVNLTHITLLDNTSYNINTTVIIFNVIIHRVLFTQRFGGDAFH